MVVSKMGFGSIIAGLVLLIAIYFLGFQQPSLLSAAWAMIASAVVGGFILAGVFLVILGILLIVI